MDHSLCYEIDNETFLTPKWQGATRFSIWHHRFSSPDWSKWIQKQTLSWIFTLPAREVPGCMFSQVHTKTMRDFERQKLPKQSQKSFFFCYLCADSKQLKYPYFTLKVSVLNSQPMKTRFWTVWVLFIPVDFSQRTTLFNP